jgi:hypothetical protein
MHIEVFHGKVRKAKSKIWKPEWFFHFQGGNNRNQGGGGEGYKKLASAVNAVETILVQLKAEFGSVKTVVTHADGTEETFEFVSLATAKLMSGRRFARHNRTYGMLVSVSVVPPKAKKA